VAQAALLDLDGTLIDANYHHALAWYRAFRRFEIVLPMWGLHRHIGMGGDQYVRAVAGEDVERRLGDELRDAHAEEFEPIRDECEPLEGAADLLAELRKRGLTLVVASSSSKDDLEYFLGKLGGSDVVDSYTTKDDVRRTKPHPDPIQAALDQAGTHDAVMLGDSGWDVEAAAKAGLSTICVITGGWSEQELRDAGAAAVFDSIPHLLDHLDETPLREGAPVTRSQDR
jgi:HAD superfamily hydrolase (TIGR01549 family)